MKYYYTSASTYIQYNDYPIYLIITAINKITNITCCNLIEVDSEMTEEELLKQAQLASAREFEANQEKQLKALASTDNCKTRTAMYKGRES